MLLNLAAAPSSCQAVRDAGIAMVLQSLIHSVAAALSSRSGRRSPRSQRDVYRKVCLVSRFDRRAVSRQHSPSTLGHVKAESFPLPRWCSEHTA